MGLTKKKVDRSAICVEEEAISSIGSTVGSFQNRLHKRLEEQEAQCSQAEKDASLRNGRILQALNTIRRALQETQKIKLGERFQLELEVNDWNGWPRLELNLVDSLAPDSAEQSLIVTAHDRKQSGTVEFRTKAGAFLGDLSLLNDSEMKKIPAVLKRSVRAYLDAVAEYVLNPKTPDELLAKKIELEDEPIDVEGQKLKSVDVFADDEVHFERNQVRYEEESTPVLEVQLDK